LISPPAGQPRSIGPWVVHVSPSDEVARVMRNPPEASLRKKRR
jgi:hypothetical protein